MARYNHRPTDLEPESRSKVDEDVLVYIATEDKEGQRLHFARPGVSVSEPDHRYDGASSTRNTSRFGRDIRSR